MLPAPHQTRFAFWTSDRGDFISPWTLDRGATSLSPWTPIDRAYAALDLHEGCAPIDRSGASAPRPHGQPCRLDAPLARNPYAATRGETTEGKPDMASGSQKRKTTAQIKVNCTPAQKTAIMDKADAAGYSPAAICLNALLDTPLPSRRRPSVDTKLLAQVLAELGKIGSNINQIAYHLNAGRPGDRIEGSVEAALADLLEWRGALMQALGYERDRKDV